MSNNLSKTVCSSPEDGLKIVNCYDCKLVMIKKFCFRRILISPNLIWNILQIPYIVNWHQKQQTAHIWHGMRSKALMVWDHYKTDNVISLISIVCCSKAPDSPYTERELYWFRPVWYTIIVWLLFLQNTSNNKWRIYIQFNFNSPNWSMHETHNVDSKSKNKAPTKLGTINL